jgi:CheY-like chemotaxis protein
MEEQKHTMLIVDDDQDQRFLAQRTFESLGTRFKVQLASSGQEAVAYLKGEGRFADRKTFEFPSYILTDLNMDPGDGFHVLEFLKNTPALSVPSRRGSLRFLRPR